MKCPKRWSDARRFRKSLVVVITVAAALCLRIPGIGWGLPPVTPQVVASGQRCSYAFDECHILNGVARADVRRLDFDAHEYHWGTLHIELVLLALDGAQAAGFFRTPWRIAYSNMVGGEFQRVYVVGRLVAVATALLTVWLLFCFSGEWAGPFAAMLVAVSPSHMLQSDQVRVDVTMTAMVVLTLLVGIRIQRTTGKTANHTIRQFLFLGIAAGLAIAAKYSAVSAVAAIALTALLLQRFPSRGMIAVAGGTLLGFLCTAPFILFKSLSHSAINTYARATANVPPEFAISIGRLMEMHLVNLIRFSMGLLAFLLAIGGILWMLRRRSSSDWMILAATVGYAVILIPLRWPLIRYDIPLGALLGLCAGVALEQLPKRWRYGLTAAALIMPLGGTIAQIYYMRSPHPADLMLERILEVVPPGTPIAGSGPEVPPLDEKIYPMGPDVLMDDLTRKPPAWVLISDLPIAPYPPSNLALLRYSYDEVAHFESRRILAWATLGETRAPHDWKYTHFSFTLYHRRPQ
jgi:hypothetical protein